MLPYKDIRFRQNLKDELLAQAISETKCYNIHACTSSQKKVSSLFATCDVHMHGEKKELLPKFFFTILMKYPAKIGNKLKMN